MNKNKINEYAKKIAIHTIEVRTENNFQNAELIEMLKQNENLKIAFDSSTSHAKSKFLKLVLNLNKLSESKYMYNDFETFLEMFKYFEMFFKSKLKIHRVDICFDFYNSNDYMKFFKLHLYILNLIAFELNIKEAKRYLNSDISNNEFKEIKISNDYYEFSYYNKKIQTNNNTFEPFARFEIRFKRLNNNNDSIKFEDCYSRIEKLFNKIQLTSTKNIFEETQKYINLKLFEAYNSKIQNQKDIKFLKDFKSDEDFILTNHYLFFSSKQLQDFFKLIGYKNYVSKAYKFKNKFKMLEFFTLTDVNLTLKEIKKSLSRYFFNSVSSTIKNKKVS